MESNDNTCSGRSGNPSSNSTGRTTLPPLPHHSQQQHSVIIDNGHGEYFSVDGLQYSIASDDANVYSSQDVESVFSCDDLYAVAGAFNPDTTNANASVADDASAWQTCGFIPIGSSSICQLQSSTTGSSSGGSNDGKTVVTSIDETQLRELMEYPPNGVFFRRLMINENPAAVNLGDLSSTNSTQSSSDASLNTTDGSSKLPPPQPYGGYVPSPGGGNNGGDIQSDVMQSPAAGLTPEDGGKLKVRKPRGRKPKHVKEGELAAAAALSSSNAGNSLEQRACSSPSGGVGKTARKPLRRLLPKAQPGNGNDVNPIPNVTIHHYAVNGNMAPPTPTQPPQHQQKRPSNKFNGGGGGHPPQQMSMTTQGGRVILLTKRSNATPTAAQIPPNRQYHQYILSSPSPKHPPQISNPPPHPIHANDTVSSTINRGGRLDQLFSSRIAAPSNKTIVKPKIIEENKQIYALLTAPTTPRSNEFESGKLSQERWMQFPNPSILPDEDFGENSEGLGGDNEGDGSRQEPQDANKNSYASPSRQQQVHAHHYQPPSQDNRPSQQSQQNLPPTQRSRFIFSHGGVNIRRDGEILGGVGVNENARVPCPYGVSQGSSGGGGGGFYHSRQAHISSGSGGSNGGYYSFSRSQWMQINQRFKSLTHDCYEQKSRVSFLQNENKDLLQRLRHVCEQNEAWKSYVQQIKQFSGPREDYPLPPTYNFGGGEYLMRHGVGSAMPPPPYMDDRYLRRGRDMMMGNENEGGLSGRVGVGDERGGIDASYYDNGVESLGLSAARRNGGGGLRSEVFSPYATQRMNRPRCLVENYNGMFSSEEDLTARSSAVIESGAATSREALHRARGLGGDRGNVSSGSAGVPGFKRVATGTVLPLDPRGNQNKKRRESGEGEAFGAEEEENISNPPNDSPSTDQGGIIHMKASLMPTPNVGAVEKEEESPDRNISREIGQETDKAEVDSITNSPGTLTELGLAVDGENTTSTLFSSPCSTENGLSGYSAPPLDSIASAADNPAAATVRTEFLVSVSSTVDSASTNGNSANISS